MDNRGDNGLASTDAMTPERLRPILFGRRADWVIAIFIMVTAIGFIAMLQSLPVRATFFPWFITVAIMVAGGIYAVGKIRRPDRWDGQYDPEVPGDHGERDTGPAFLVEHARGIVRALAIFVALIAATFAVGPEYALPVFITIMLWGAGESRYLAVASGLAFWLVIHFVFGDAMSINLPTGLLTDMIFR